MTKRRVFISYQHHDQMKAKGFNLMSYNKHVDIEFTGRHLLDPLKSNDSDYISRKIREQLNGSSATVVLIGDQTAASSWVEREVQWSIDKGNGIIGVRLDSDASVPDALKDAGAEILDWNEVTTEFNNAIERAIAATFRKMPFNNAGTCARV